MKVKRSRFATALAVLALVAGAAGSAQGQERPAGLAFNPFYIAISVENMDAMSAFYVDKLGFKVEKDAALGQALKFRWLTNGAQRVELIQMNGSQPGPARQRPPGHLTIRGFSHIGIETPDIEATRAALLAKGVTPVGNISTLAPLGMKAMFVVDPEGNAIEIIQRLPG
jgi:catechol 2,3-dioxygenase-like lactoylglutathione lyase family enzyme